MSALIAGSSLAAAPADAAPLPSEAVTILSSQCPALKEDDSDRSTTTLPQFAELCNALELPVERSKKPEHVARLPLRILSGAASSLEKSCWKHAMNDGGLHELLSVELIEAIAKRVRRVLGRIELHGLVGRADLNGQAACVIGPLEKTTGRVPVKVDATGECVRAKLANAFHSAALPTVLECGAGAGALSYFLAQALDGYAAVVAADSHRDKLNARGTVGGLEVAHLDSAAAITLHDPEYVVMCWQPSGVDWTLHCRAEGGGGEGVCGEMGSISGRGSRCREYLLLGEADSSTCGDEWATWGVVPANGDAYGLDEDSIPPFMRDGFTRVELAEVAQWMACRFDSSEARGFSTAIAFTKRGFEPPPDELAEEAEETLEAAWERMQRSVRAGTAQKLDVQMQMDVTR